jgi:small GTP-binding protein
MSSDKTKKCILCIRGHVDTGKTSFVQKLASHNTSIANKDLTKSEAGGITQRAGTTTFERDHIKKFIPENLRDKFNIDFVTIDTPGHTNFENIRKIGSSIAHITLVFVDIIKGIDQDTLEFLSDNIESLTYDRIILVLNKIDTIYGYKQMNHANIKKILNSQSKDVVSKLDDYVRKISNKLSNIGLYGELYYNKKCKDCLTMIPISAHTGDGIPDLMLYLSNAKLNIYDKEEKSIGYIIDKVVDNRLGKIIIGILKYGQINKNSAIKISNSYFPITNLMRTVGYTDSRECKFEHTNTVSDAISFCFKVDQTLYDLINFGDEFESINKNESDLDLSIAHIDNEVYEKQNAKKSILSDYGIHIIIPSESMLEGIIYHFKQENIPICSYSIQTITKKDLIIYGNKREEPFDYYDRYRIIMTCLPELTENIEHAKLLSDNFDDDKQKLIKEYNLKVIFGGTIYRLSSLFNEHIKQSQLGYISKYGVFSQFEAELIPKFVFRTDDPIICGIKMISGVLHIGSEVISSDGKKYYGKVIGIQLEKKDIEVAYSEMEVCIKLTGGSDNIIKDKPLNFKNKSEGSKMSSIISKLVMEDIKVIKPKPSIPKVKPELEPEIMDLKKKKEKGQKYNNDDSDDDKYKRKQKKEEKVKIDNQKKNTKNKK